MYLHISTNMPVVAVVAALCRGSYTLAKIALTFQCSPQASLAQWEGVVWEPHQRF